MQPSRRILALTIGVFILLLLLVLAWVGVPRWGPAQSPLPEQLRSAVAKSESFVKNHVTGGVGAVLTVDGTTGLPRIASVLPGSPAETAGLLAGDTIVRINESPTAGQKLAQVVDAIRGFSAGEVTVTVQRADSTNLTFVIHRASWSALGVTNQSGAPMPASAVVFTTNSSVIMQPGGFVLTNLTIQLDSSTNAQVTNHILINP